MPRAKIWGILAVLLSAGLFTFSVYAVFFIAGNDGLKSLPVDLNEINTLTYLSVAVPVAASALFVLGAGFWIGWVILSIKVVPPMPEIVEKKDYSRIKAFLLCLGTAALAAALVYGLYVRSFWALAVPALIISLVVLGAVFWVGLAIITTRSTLPTNGK